MTECGDIEHSVDQLGLQRFCVVADIGDAGQEGHTTVLALRFVMRTSRPSLVIATCIALIRDGRPSPGRVSCPLVLPCRCPDWVARRQFGRCKDRRCSRVNCDGNRLQPHGLLLGARRH